MQQISEILSLDHIKILVDQFYDKVRKDPLLAPIFIERIGNCWSQHLEKMYTFWQTVLLGQHTYYGSPFPPHATLPVDHHHFERWLMLFNQTIDENFSGEIAEEARWRAGKMAEMFQLKINYYRKHHSKPIT